MHRVVLIRRPSQPRGGSIRKLWALALGLLCPAASAADLPPQLVAEFTRRVQPLVLNRCAAGACHGGPQSPAPRFARRDPRGGIDRRSTLANLQAFLDAVGPDRDAATLAALLAVQHPAKPASPRLVAAPLSPRERITLDAWLGGVRLAERKTISDPAVMQASAVAPATSVAPPGAPARNPFKDLLESAANPPQFPPPQEPKGIIFPNDVPPADD